MCLLSERASLATVIKLYVRLQTSSHVMCNETSSFGSAVSESLSCMHRSELGH